MGVWQLQDSPIFWFVAAPVPPPPSPGIITTYLAGFFPGEAFNEDVVAQKLPDEQQAKIWRGDERHYWRQ